MSSDQVVEDAPFVDTEPAETKFEIEQGIPQYQYGHFDTSLDAFPMIFEMGGFKNGWILLGDKPDGPILTVVELGPNIKDDHAHFHNAAQVRLIVKGSQRIGNLWYKQGDIRIQEPGKYYGPEETGPEGVTQLLFFSDRRGMFPHYRRRPGEGEGLGMFKGLMAASGIEAN